MVVKNKEVEKFFLDFLPKHEEVKMTDCSGWLHNYYKEAEDDEAFNAKYYETQDDRLDDMFHGMPEGALNLLKLKAFKHRADHHEESNDERIKELETAVSGTVYQEVSVAKWWLN